MQPLIERSAQIVQRLEPVLALYCECDHRKIQTRQALLCSGIRQLIEQLDPFRPLPQDVYDAWKKYKDDNGGLPVEECPKLLLSLVQQMEKCFIALDGLDEYVSNDIDATYSQYPSDILEDLHDITSKCQGHCRMLVASRDDIYYLYKGRIEACYVEVKAQDTDVTSYVTSRLLSRKFKFHQELQQQKFQGLREEIVQRLCQKANGM